MINIAICDDESAEISYLSAIVHRWACEREVDVRVRGYDSAESFLFARGDDDGVDILLLDIQMKVMDGVELARKIRSAGDEVQIVFITGFPDFIAEGYDVSALHYLMKPVRDEKLAEVLKAAARLEKAEETLLVSASETTEKIPLGSIVYIESFAHYIAIRTKTAAVETRANIGDIETKLGDGFVRCHRSYIVGLDHVSRITKTDVILDGGKAIPLSRRLYADVNRAFITHHKGRRNLI
jgi:Response regulator of the LytR/AlgR family